MNNEAGKISPERAKAQATVEAVKKRIATIDRKLADLQTRMRAAEQALDSATTRVTRTQRLLAEDAPNASLELTAAQHEQAEAEARLAGVHQLLTETESTRQVPYAEYEAAVAMLSAILQREEEQRLEKELAATKDDEARIELELASAQQGRARAWEALRVFRLRKSEAEHREQMARLRAENRPLPGYERTRNMPA